MLLLYASSLNILGIGIPPIPQSALKVLQKFLIQKLFVINFEYISNPTPLISKKKLLKYF